MSQEQEIIYGFRYPSRLPGMEGETIGSLVRAVEHLPSKLVDAFVARQKYGNANESLSPLVVAVCGSLERIAKSLEELTTLGGTDREQALKKQGFAKLESAYLNAEEAAQYLGTSVKSLYGIVERGHLKPFRGPKNRYRFTVEMLDKYLQREN